ALSAQGFGVADLYYLVVSRVAVGARCIDCEPVEAPARAHRSRCSARGPLQADRRDPAGAVRRVRILLSPPRRRHELALDGTASPSAPDPCARADADLVRCGRRFHDDLPRPASERSDARRLVDPRTGWPVAFTSARAVRGGTGGIPRGKQRSNACVGSAIRDPQRSVWRWLRVDFLGTTAGGRD